MSTRVQVGSPNITVVNAVQQTAVRYVTQPTFQVSQASVQVQKLTESAGIVGPSGAQGPKGDKGDNGNNGNDGAQGPKGDKGNNGNDGAQGPKGDKGDAGIPGETGTDGLPGAAGPAGVQGPQGPAGADAVLTQRRQIMDANDGISTITRVGDRITMVRYSSPSFPGIIITKTLNYDGANLISATWS